MENYAFALAGGGAKGIYQIGAWKALEEIGISCCAVAGTSIGAVNGAFIAQGDYQKAYDMWANIRMDQCVHLSEPHGLVSDNLLDRQHAGMLLREVIFNGGIDQSPFQQLLTTYLSVESVYASDVDLGICTFELTSRSAVKIWKRDIPKDLFFSYLLASSAYPGLKIVKFEEKRYMDGGISDNLPLDMLSSRGYRNIVAIDIRSEKNRALVSDRLRITHICNSMDLGGTLDLSPEILSRNFELGYLDTYKTFGKYDGIHYYIPTDEYQNLMRMYKDIGVSGFEQAALAYKIPREQARSADDFLRILRAKRQESQAEYEKGRKKIDADGILSAVRNGSLHKLKRMSPSLRLSLLMELIADAKKNGSKWTIPAKLFRDLDLAANALLLLDPPSLGDQ